MSVDHPSPLTPEMLISLEACFERIRELEARLEESEETLDAIRRGAIDAVVVNTAVADHRVYTLENADSPYRVLIEQMQEGAVTLGPDGTVFYCNRRLAEMLGVPQQRIIGQLLQDFVREEDRAAFERLLREAAQGSVRDELAFSAADGTVVPVSMSLSMPWAADTQALVCGVLTDLTQQKAHLNELSDANAMLRKESAQRETVEEALRQSQKMEAVGQLTGGLAHDFNNLLTGIVGSLQMMQRRVEQGRVGELERYISAAQASADRAAALTHRLLAFSRRQTLDPKPVAINQLVAGMVDLLRRTVGPTIAVETRLAEDVGSILCDYNQLENALLNLAINARDAMPQGGRLLIETAAAEVEPAFAAARDMQPGRYVSLGVTDNGTGMSAEVVARAFDPFFTTKPLGLGTGLGLSMIYGFVKQSGGQVRIHSKLGDGTTIWLYLPPVEAASEAALPSAALKASPVSAGETVLVVDDEPVVRMLVVEALEELGYGALEAFDGASALRYLESDARVDLLVTDVGLPGGMNGRQIADRARMKRKDLKVLFITGFAEAAVIGNGILDPGMQVLTKPFAMDALAGRIQQMIKG